MIYEYAPVGLGVGVGVGVGVDVGVGVCCTIPLDWRVRDVCGDALPTLMESAVKTMMTIKTAKSCFSIYALPLRESFGRSVCSH